jgi:undecaprenyl-diphosphatase
MNGFDRAISLFVNGAAQKSAAVDQIIFFLSNSDLIKGGVVLGVIWAAWFFAKGDIEKNRFLLLSAILGSLLALLVARILAHEVPLRLRPVLDTTLHFRSPIGLPSQTNWTTWSSFPSDHAALFFALAWGAWGVSRRVGTVLFFYIVVMICLPRLYVGIHYPTDVIAGAALGIVSTILLQTAPFKRIVLLPLLSCAKRWPGAFYFVLFLLTFEIATLFWDIRMALSWAGYSV